MLHTKFQGHRSIGSGEEDFLRFLPYMGMAAILVMWPKPFEQLFVPRIPGGYIWNLVTIGPAVSEEKSFEIVDGRRTTTDNAGRRRTTEPAYTISSPGAFGSGELKNLMMMMMMMMMMKGTSKEFLQFCVHRCINMYLGNGMPYDKSFRTYLV